MKYTYELEELKKNGLREKCEELRLPTSHANGKALTNKEMRASLTERLELVPSVQTENTGLTFEMAICINLGIDYVGKFKYSMEEASRLAHKMGSRLREYITEPLTHTAHGQGKYDFTGETLRLSAKSNKNDYNVCPQTIGQPTRKRFCEIFGLASEQTDETLKQHILDNVQDMLAMYSGNTFDCTILYYHQKEGSMKLIQPNKETPIDWAKQTISFTQSTAASWNECNTIRVEVEPGVTKTIGSFQFHNKRNCIKFRWNINNLVSAFHESFTVRPLC